jgi:hypothetical protein
MAMVLVYGLLLYHPATEHFALSLRGENRPIELLGFLGLLAGGCCGGVATWKAMRSQAPRHITLFFGLFSCWALFTAMEEIAWGQWFFRFETPESIVDMNQQSELTIHNLGPFQGRSEFLRVAFALGGLIGVGLGRHRLFRVIAPPLLLLPWFVTIFCCALPDLYVDFYSISTYADRFINRFAEFVEMMIGLIAVLYIFLRTQPVLEVPVREWAP